MGHCRPGFRRRSTQATGFSTHVRDPNYAAAASGVSNGGRTMILGRRQFLQLASAAAGALPRVAHARDYPVRPVRVLVAVAPGGGADIVARLIGQWLSERLGTQVLVDNRPGGGNNIGTEMVVRAGPDGYTLLMANMTPAINAP